MDRLTAADETLNIFVHILLFLFIWLIIVKNDVEIGLHDMGLLIVEESY